MSTAARVAAAKRRTAGRTDLVIRQVMNEAGHTFYEVAHKEQVWRGDPIAVYRTEADARAAIEASAL